MFSFFSVFHVLAFITSLIIAFFLFGGSWRSRLFSVRYGCLVPRCIKVSASFHFSNRLADSFQHRHFWGLSRNLREDCVTSSKNVSLALQADRLLIVIEQFDLQPHGTNWLLKSPLKFAFCVGSRCDKKRTMLSLLHWKTKSSLLKALCCRFTDPRAIER